MARHWGGLGDGSAAWNDLIDGEGEAGREFLVPRVDGAQIWVLVGSVKVEDEDGVYHFVQLVDVTPQRTLQDSLKALVEAKDEFIASVSHELRTPLTAVVGFSDMLVHDQGLAGEERAEVQELVLNQAVSVSHIVDDLLVVGPGGYEEIVHVGCHEPKNQAPTGMSTVPLAWQRAPSKLQPEHEEALPISFPRLVQPVLDKHCVECHAGSHGID